MQRVEEHQYPPPPPPPPPQHHYEVIEYEVPCPPPQPMQEPVQYMEERPQESVMYYSSPEQYQPQPKPTPYQCKYQQYKKYWNQQYSKKESYPSQVTYEQYPEQPPQQVTYQQYPQYEEVAPEPVKQPADKKTPAIQIYVVWQQKDRRGCENGDKPALTVHMIDTRTADCGLSDKNITSLLPLALPCQLSGNTKLVLVVDTKNGTLNSNSTNVQS